MKDHRPRLVSSSMIYASFVLGLLTAIAIRAIIVLNHIEPSWVRPIWYFAVIGNFFFFYYRYKISQKRRKAVDEYQLIKKIQTNPHIQKEDRDVLVYLLFSIRRSLENINYLIIFLFSIVAIAIDLILSAIE
ncbi:MAG: hypothetical protein JSV13_05380 [Nitrospiraceae bacterium]|nr:MAG: hypothetical protein JSV13_05380 [Nitrospiraceae bacterium]